MLHRATLFYKEKSDDENENSDWVFIQNLYKIVFSIF